ncbi:hypothetical protein I7I48_11624 [Histoplasma ohiense]|nr:hypothetical protein I7I48_11624 [Histoplasma ohiense (nom. inval.)]
MSPQLPAAPESIDVNAPVTQTRECSQHGTAVRRRSARPSHPLQRYYSHHNFPKPIRHSELRFKGRNSARQLLGRDPFGRRRKLCHSSSSATSGEQNAACLSIKPYPSEGSLLEQPANIPQMITPNARETPFTDTMSGAFNFTKSPLRLGKTSAAPAAFPEKEPWVLRNTHNPFGSDTISHTDSCLSATYPSQKECMRAQANQRHYSNSLVPGQNQSYPMTVGFGLTHRPSTTETDEFSRLLQTIELHSRQSKGIADLVSSYLEREASYSDINPEGGDVINKFFTKPLRQLNQDSEGSLQVASLPGGGDSPDPPRTPFRGHMIDRIDSGGAVVGLDENKSGQGRATASHENIPQNEGPGIARDSQVPNNTNTQKSHPPASCNSNCTYFAMPVCELLQGPALSTSEFGGFYDTFVPSAASDNSFPRKRPISNIGDACQNKLDLPAGCCSQQAKAYTEKSDPSEKSQYSSNCRGCRPKRVKVDHFTGQPDSVYQIGVDHKPLEAPLTTQGPRLHHSETLSAISQSSEKPYSAPTTPGYQRMYGTRQKKYAVPPLADIPPNCACRPHCSCSPPCQCGQDTNVEMTMANTPSSKPPLGISTKSLMTNSQNCACQPHCSCPLPCQCGQDADAKTGRRNTSLSVQQPHGAPICAFPLFQITPQKPDLPVNEIHSSQFPQCGRCA